MPLAYHILIEYLNCDFATLDSVEKVEEALIDTAKTAGLTVVKPVFHKFAPQGVSGVVVIAESHISIHTWPEHGYAAVDVFTCNELADTSKIIEMLKEKFGADSFETHTIERGTSKEVAGPKEEVQDD